MASGYASWNLLLLLLIMSACRRTVARDLKIQANKLDHHNDHDDHAHDPFSHMNHMDMSSMIFFTLNELKLGKTMAIYFQERDPSVSPPFLPREKADSIPFSLKQLPYLLQHFSYQPDSPRAKAMEHTLKNCEVPPMKGETKLCATSLESMLDFARENIGLDSDIEVLTTTHLRNSRSVFQNYTILEAPREIHAPKVVACHTLAYPYAIFYCHSLEDENKVFKVSLAGHNNGDRLEAVAICHMDTSHWNPDNVAFHLLDIKPGSHVCHFFHAENLVFVPNPMCVSVSVSRSSTSN